MDIQFDPEKEIKNIEKHGISLTLARELDWDEAWVEPDTRFEYGEVRLRASGNIRGRLHVFVFTMRGESIRAISLRRANKRETRNYAQQR